MTIPTALPKLSQEHILVFDPGESTGIVEVIYGDIVNTITFTLEEMMINIIRRFNSLYGMFPFAHATMIVERFVLYPTKSQSMTLNKFPSCEVIGMLKVIARKLEVKIVFQSAVEAKKFATDQLLTAYGWKQQCKTKHELDAARHALLYLARKGSK